MNLSLVFCGFAALLSVSPAFAQQQKDAQSFKLGETDLFPSVKLEFFQNDNAFLTEADPTSTTAFKISPTVDWVAQRRLLKLQAGYEGVYQAASEDAINFNDHRLTASVDAEMSKRKRFKASVYVALGHEDLGRNLTRGIATADSEQVEFVDTGANANFTYGADRAKGNLTGGINLGNFNYTNRDDVTNGRDSTYFEPYGIFSYRLSGDTRATLELRHRTIDSSPTRDRTDLSVLAGMQFAATGKTGGKIAVGSTQSNYKSDNIDDNSNFIVEGALFWEPTTFSRFTLNLDRKLDGTVGGLTSTDSTTDIRDQAELIWDYAWSERLRHSAIVGLSNVDSECPNRGSRTTTAGIGVDLRIRRWMSVGVQAATENRVLDDCSTDPVTNPNQDYDRAIVGLYLKATL